MICKVSVIRKLNYLIEDDLNELLGGEAGIRTLGRLPFNGFQDRRIRPLCHLSDRQNTNLMPVFLQIVF
ncbi:protein of unknown function [Legionella fallonii LLAP-10]|uniref:Uncharacterized protein n=1 Tax=Legionella fallonii LLAP-10 TaxID=1212491 RepID=A0A098G4Z1_9GAMM|nr:protein of unknown function [Legionella fallonii LLAP-10]